MVRPIQMYEDSKGNVHRTEHDAWRGDLAIHFAATGLVNDVTAKQMIDKFCTDLDTADELKKLVIGAVNTMEHAAS